MKSFSQGSRNAIAYPHFFIVIYSPIIVFRSYSSINLVSKSYATERIPKQQDVYARSLYMASLLKERATSAIVEAKRHLSDCVGDFGRGREASTGIIS